MHPVVVEIFQPGPKWWADWLTDIAIHGAKLLTLGNSIHLSWHRDMEPNYLTLIIHSDTDNIVVLRTYKRETQMRREGWDSERENRHQLGYLKQIRL